MDVDRCLVSIPWETRNLGLQSFHVSDIFVRQSDVSILQEAINKKIEEYGRIFVQARVSTNDSLAIATLEQNGFYFVEMVLVPYTNLKTNKVLKHFIDNRDAFVPDRSGREEWKMVVVDKADTPVIRRIKDIAVESFIDDRFHRDWQCDKETASRRFSYWVDDLAADNETAFIIITHNGKPKGFMVRTFDNLILAGLSRKSVGKGIGKFFWLSALEDMLNAGSSDIHTLISVSNIPVLNLYAGLGFKFKEPAVTLHYWQTS
ncbi:MAG: GNAT family protein [Planctomycetota bacterium]|jgi:hypothetical protein